MARRRGAFWHDADCTYAFNALEKTRHHTNAIGKNGATDNELVVTGYSVRPGGICYIIVATYLPLMAKDAGSPLLTAHLWTLVGLSIVPGCFGWLWAAKRWWALPCLTANLLVQAICVLLTLASDSPLLLIISSLGFGGTFMGTTSLVMTIARQTERTGKSQSFRLCGRSFTALDKSSARR
ncbi:major facilitator superfamily protein [Escherichia coli]|uniref:Major facilitator superfamily protein n=1 Tax=Escherichia coli TaxID=562 RepID=A0A377E4E5_ECOLX|nr:major facilitator superfamily protein [Escherichia coli]